jgi:DNA-binding MarR family transcriptional regulator
VRSLDDELRRVHGLSLNSLELLWHLLSAPDHRMRMVDLADQLVFTRSGMTRLIERLERDGLVERSGAEDDKRGIYASITEDGAERFSLAADSHVAGLRRVFLDKLDKRDLRALNEIWARFEWPSNREREARRRSRAAPREREAR